MKYVLIRLIAIMFVLVLSSLSLMGCAGFGKKAKSFLAGENNTVTETTEGVPSKKLTKFSEEQNAGYKVPRQYKRMTQKRLEQENRVQSDAGSLWVDEGQSSYLFTQNIVRREGDILNVKLDGAPLKQIETKVKVIKRLLSKLEQTNRMKRQLASVDGGGDNKDANGSAKTKAKGTKGNKANPAGNADNNNQNGENQGGDAETDSTMQAEKESNVDGAIDVESVPTRIVERMPDGNYRVKGNQSFMIGKREYKVLVTGIVRADDFNDEGILSTKLLDPQFDIVSLKRKASSSGATL